MSENRARESYTSPLAERYASEAMRRNFSDARRHRLWRKLWLVLAESQRASSFRGNFGLIPRWPVRADQNLCIEDNVVFLFAHAG